jgi:hypothetical protein
MSAEARLVSLVVLVALSLVAICTPIKSFKSSFSPMLNEHNLERMKHGLGKLELDNDLCSYAQNHAESMSKRGRLVHSSMSELAIASGNGNVAENIAWGQESEVEAVDAWMNSSGHRQNILGKRYTRVGFGVKADDKGRKYWCAVFAG